MGWEAIFTLLVTLNLFQGPSCGQNPFHWAKWMLKQVQHDEGRNVAIVVASGQSGFGVRFPLGHARNALVSGQTGRRFLIAFARPLRFLWP